MKFRKSSVRIVLTTNDEAEAQAKVDSFLPNKRYDKMRVSLWNLSCPDTPVDTKDKWLVFEIIV